MSEEEKGINEKDLGILGKDFHHYEMPNFSNCNFNYNLIVLYDYTNKEKDIITQAFRANNCILLLIRRSILAIIT